MTTTTTTGEQEEEIERRMKALSVQSSEANAVALLNEILKFAKEKEVNAEVLVRLGAGRLTVVTMKELQDKNEDIAMYGCGALAIIARNQDEQDQLKGAAQQVVRAMKLYALRNDGVAVNATGAVLGLAVKNAESRMEFVRLDAPNAVIAAMKAWAWRNLEVAINGCAALWDLTENVAHEDLAEMSVKECGEAIMEALKNFGEINEDVAVFGTAVIENLLAFDDDEQHTARKQMRSEGIVELIERMRRKHLSDTFTSTANSVLRILDERRARKHAALVRREEESGKRAGEVLNSSSTSGGTSGGGKVSTATTTGIEGERHRVTSPEEEEEAESRSGTGEKPVP